LLYILLSFIAQSLHKPEGYPLDGTWTVVSDDQITRITLPHFETSDQENVVVYKTTFDKMDANTLVIPSLSAYGIEVMLNGEQIYRIGNPAQKTANIWNYSHMVTFDNKRLKEENTLEIKLYSLFDHGIGNTPYLANQSEILTKVQLANFFKNDIFLISIGISFSFGIILIILGFGIPERKGVHFSFGMASILVAIYIFDFQFRISTGSMVNFLTLRKIFFSSLYTGIFMLLQGVEFFIYGRRRFSKYLQWIIPAMVLAIMVSPNFFVFQNVHVYSLYVVLVLMLISCVEIFMRMQKEFLFAATFLVLCVIHDVSAALFGLDYTFYVGYGIILTVFSISIVIIAFFKNTYSNMENARRKAQRDPLTGAFNRSAFDNLVFNEDDLLIVVDFDDFKAINDRYGHDEGDRLLKLFYTISSENMRQGDMIIRIGGDEFVFLLRSCPVDSAKKRMRQIKEEINAETDQYTFDFSYGFHKVESSIDKTFNIADSALYKMKNAKKQNG